MQEMSPPLPWLSPGQGFPPPAQAWGPDDPAPGLLAAGADLSPQTLVSAYSQGIFPWFSPGQPILWWSPDPRMVLLTGNFKLHRSLRRVIRQFAKTPGCEIRVDGDFSRLMACCAQAPRKGQGGTWIVPQMIEAYKGLNAAGLAHSVETWVDQQLVGGLYFVNLGGMVFGESMFAQRRDASKIALAALVVMCRRQGLDLIDCQQSTSHLTSLGACDMPRPEFLARVAERIERGVANWHFDRLYWSEIA